MKAAPPQQASLNELWGSKGKKTSAKGKEAVKPDATPETSKDVAMEEVDEKKVEGESSVAITRKIDEEPSPLQ